MWLKLQREVFDENSQTHPRKSAWQDPQIWLEAAGVKEQSFLCEKQIMMKDICRTSSLKKTSGPPRPNHNHRQAELLQTETQRQRDTEGKHTVWDTWENHETSHELWGQTTHGNKCYILLRIHNSVEAERILSCVVCRNQRELRMPWGASEKETNSGDSSSQSDLNSFSLSCVYDRWNKRFCRDNLSQCLKVCVQRQ